MSDLDRDIYEVANQLGGYVGPGTEERLAKFLIRESNEAAKLADEIERLRRELADVEIIAEKLFDSEDMMKAEADARRQAFIEAAELIEGSGSFEAVPLGPYGASEVQWVGPNVHELASALRAKAEEIQP